MQLLEKNFGLPANGPINVVAVTDPKIVGLSNVLFVNVCVAVNCTILLLLIKAIFVEVVALPVNGPINDVAVTYPAKVEVKLLFNFKPSLVKVFEESLL